MLHGHAQVGLGGSWWTLPIFSHQMMCGCLSAILSRKQIWTQFVAPHDVKSCTFSLSWCQWDGGGEEDWRCILQVSWVG